LTTPTDILLAQVAAGLSQIATSGYQGKAKAEDAYEAFVWWRMVRAAESLGWTVTLHGPGPGQFLFRCGPGNIYSPAPYTYAQLDRPGWPSVEVHLGIMITGRSGVAHEFDVVALTKDGADLARVHHRDPHWSTVAAHAECKFYGAPVGLDLARGLWGLSADCRLRLKGGLVSNSGPADSVTKVLGKHGVYYRPHAVPHNTADLDAALTDRLTCWLASQGVTVP
jgi:hypothetical protein